MSTVRSVFILLLFQLMGEGVSRFAHIPLPGPVIGMALLTAWYIGRRCEPDPAVAATADDLLGVLGLLFVPAGVGIVANLTLLRSAWLPLSVALVLSTLLTLLITASIVHRLDRGPSPSAEGKR